MQINVRPDEQLLDHCRWGTEQSGSSPGAALSFLIWASSPWGPPGSVSHFNEIQHTTIKRSMFFACKFWKCPIHKFMLLLWAYTSAHPSPCCCCNMMTASSAFPSPLTSRNCKSLSTLFEYLETKQILTIPVCTAKIYPVQPTPPNLVTQYTWCWCTKNTLVPICTESPRTKCVQLASTCLPRVHPVLLRPPYSSPEDQRRRWQRNRFCSNPAWRQSSELG